MAESDLRRRQLLYPPSSITVAPIPLPIPTISDISPFLPPLPPSSSSSPSSATSSAHLAFSSAASNPTASNGFAPSSTHSTSASGSGDRNLPQFKLVYLIPAIVVVGIITLIFFIWSIQKCCTRPRRREHDPEKEFGYAPYSPNSTYYQPSRHEYNALHPRQSYNGFVQDPRPVRVMPPPPPLPTAPQPEEAHPTILTSRFSSDSLIDAGSSEEDDKGMEMTPDRTVAWESLRHKSIKRGIINQVHEEKNWMDSLRAVAGSVFLKQSPPRTPTLEERLSLSPTRRPRGVALHDDGPVPISNAPKPSENWIEEGKRRRLNLSLMSHGLAKPTTSAARSISTTLRRQSVGSDPHVANEDEHPDPGAWSPNTGFKIVPESPPVTPPANTSSRSPILRTNFQTPASQAGSSPTKVDRNPYTRRSGCFDPTISVLPLSPPQIMSPPLQNELYFTQPPVPTYQSLADFGVQPNRPPFAVSAPVLLGGGGGSSGGKLRKSRAAAAVVVQQPRPLQENRTRSESSGGFDMDKPLPNPRIREGRSNVPDVVKLDKPRNKLFKKSSVLMGFKYERLPGGRF